MRNPSFLFALSFIGFENSPHSLNTRYRIIVASVTSVTCCDGRMISDGLDADSSRDDAVKGYEYLHPDITKMLLTPASWSDTEECPFVVDPNSFVLHVKSDNARLKDADSSRFLPLHRLAYLAEECERAVFGIQRQDRLFVDNDLRQVHGKILGLICLSRLPSDWSADESMGKETSISKAATSDAALLVALIVSLNLLESSIRSVIRDFGVTNKGNSNQKKKVGAPLLRDMIEILSELDPQNSKMAEDGSIDFKALASIIRTVLLPTRPCGINLRNLVSHGFLSTIDRRWFALTVVLIQTLDSLIVVDQSCAGDINSEYVTDLKKYDAMANVVSYGQELLMNGTDDLVATLQKEFIPSQYLSMCQFIFGTLARPLHQSLKKQDPADDPCEAINGIPSLTTIFLIAASCLLEHSLRLQWCQANNKPCESIARPSKYYVTLDGHGQRDKHDIVISPYLSNGSKNLLMTKIGTSAFLLSDLFSAPSPDAPNIRAQLCHGTLDAEIERELVSLAHSTYGNHTFRQDETNKDGGKLIDAAFAVTASFEMLANKAPMTRYEPVYSYVAMWSRDLASSIDNLALLEQLVSNDSTAICINDMYNKQTSEISNGLKYYDVQLDMLREIQQLHFATSSPYDSRNIWSEYGMNIVLSECIAAQTLLNEMSRAAKRYTSFLQRAHDVLSLQPSSTKEKRSQKTTARICGLASIVLDFYTLAIYICLIMVRESIKNQNIKHGEISARSEYVKVVERTRMVLSTFDTNIDTNLDRSLKALSQYLHGKALRKVMSRRS